MRKGLFKTASETLSDIKKKVDSSSIPRDAAIQKSKTFHETVKTESKSHQRISALRAAIQNKQPSEK